MTWKDIGKEFAKAGKEFAKVGKEFNNQDVS